MRSGKAGTIARSKLTNFRMGDGEGKPTQVIVDGWVMQYVGIGWIKVLAYQPGDENLFPVVMEE